MDSIFGLKVNILLFFGILDFNISLLVLCSIVDMNIKVTTHIPPSLHIKKLDLFMELGTMPGEK